MSSPVLSRPLRLLLALAALGVTVAAAFAVAAVAGAAASSDGPQGVGAPAGPPEALPDLTIQYLTVTLETGGDCDFDSTNLGIRIYFENIGDADAGPFDVDVNNVWQTQIDGLAAGEKASLWFDLFIYPGGENNAYVDVEEEVVESDETNNGFSGILPVPTLPPTCTPTPSPTPTSTPERPEILGDVDCDFAITSLDALLVLQYVAGLIDELPCGGAADLNGDGAVTAVDAALILQIVAGLFGLY